jgi:hypothetical protein
MVFGDVLHPIELVLTVCPARQRQGPGIIPAGKFIERKLFRGIKKAVRQNGKRDDLEAAWREAD